MSTSDVSELSKILAETKVEGEREVDFSGKGLKLDSENDAEEVVQAIKKTMNMTCLNMEGNTMGVGAAKAIAKALESQPNFKRALWKDMFTGRLKSEIPEALNFLSSGIILAQAKLVELDLSDNAFGPVGIKGILMLLKSSSCYSLQILKLNNNGLGINGGKLMAEALLSCHKNSKDSNNPFSLKVFVCGRNRLENEGSKELAKVFETLGTLETVSMPQNGIYHEGIAALSKAFSVNKKLREINLNDNTFTAKGAKVLAKCISTLPNLEMINFGDCLIKTEGAKAVAESLENNNVLKELYLGFNEIEIEGGIALAEQMINKTSLQKLDIDGNHFGEEGCRQIQEIMKNGGKENALASLGDDEGSGDEEEEKDEVAEEEDESQEEIKETPTQMSNGFSPVKVSAASFLSSPTSTKLMQLGNKCGYLLLTEMGKNLNEDQYLDLFIKVSSVVTADDIELKNIACNCVDEIFLRAFSAAEEKNTVPLLTNTLLVHLGLIKSEDKKFKPPTDLQGPLIVLEHVVKQKYFSRTTKEILQLFLSRPNKAVEACGKVRHSLMQALYQF